MQDQFTDLAILREKPLVFTNSVDNRLVLVVKPVLFKEHDKFLKDMATLIVNHYEIFSTLDFLNHQTYKDQEAITAIIDHVQVFTADIRYTIFKRQATSFIKRWAYVSKKKRTVVLKHNSRLCKRFLNNTEPAEFLHILFLLFVMNFDIVKKNLIELVKIFQTDLTIESSIPTGISSHGISEKVVLMPKYSVRPFNESTLNLLEQQSKM